MGKTFLRMAAAIGNEVEKALAAPQWSTLSRSVGARSFISSGPISIARIRYCSSRACAGMLLHVSAGPSTSAGHAMSRCSALRPVTDVEVLRRPRSRTIATTSRAALRKTLFRLRRGVMDWDCSEEPLFCRSSSASLCPALTKPLDCVGREELS
eukprot:1008310-Rhodomonas_salina.4